MVEICMVLKEGTKRIRIRCDIGELTRGAGSKHYRSAYAPALLKMKMGRTTRNTH